VAAVHKTFRSIEVGDGGDGRWAAYTRGLWQEMEGLLTGEGRTPQGADRVRALFRRHMPELVPVLGRLAGQLDRPEAEAFLTHAALRPFTQSCTQLPVTDEQERALRTQERLRAIRAAGADDVAAMLRPPLYRPVDEQGSRTLYTAHYRPVEGRVTYHWPGESWQQSFGDFTPGSRTVTLGRTG
jgi:hypothetical protein